VDVVEGMFLTRAIRRMDEIIGLISETYPFD
jgi:hypothetical protein